MLTKALKEAWLKVFFSYGHKLILLLVAWAGFATLLGLSAEKEGFNNKRAERWTMTPAVAQAMQRAVPCANSTFLKKGYATREELIVAMQDKAESCVWKRLDADAVKIRGRMTSVDESSRKEALETYLSLLEIMKRKAAYAGAVRQHIGAVLRDAPLTDSQYKGTGFATMLRSTFDEDSNAHVFYEILWYGSLFLAIGASALLGVVLLTALPITDGEGYWTQLIQKFLDRIPGTANRTIAAPILAATIGVSTFAGAAVETAPGGQGWTAVDRRAHNSTSITQFNDNQRIASKKEINFNEGSRYYIEGDRNYRAGDSYYGTPYFPGDGPIYVFGPEAAGPLNDIQQKIDTLVIKNEFNSGINSVNLNIDESERTVIQHAHERFVAIGVAVQKVQLMSEQIRADITVLENDLDEVLEKVAKLEEIANKHSKEVDGREGRQLNTLGESLAQSAERDPRGAFARNFFPTVYKVGPLVPSAMEARLAQGDLDQLSLCKDGLKALTAEATQEQRAACERKAFVDALEDMRTIQEENGVTGPLKRKDFENLLIESLRARKELTESQIEALVDDHIGALLHLSAMPRR